MLVGNTGSKSGRAEQGRSRQTISFGVGEVPMLEVALAGWLMGEANTQTARSYNV